MPRPPSLTLWAKTEVIRARSIADLRFLEQNEAFSLPIGVKYAFLEQNRPFLLPTLLPLPFPQAT